MKILLDVDGVLCDFVGGYLNAVHTVTGKQYRREDITGWDIEQYIHISPEERKAVVNIIKTEGFCLGLKPIPRSFELVQWLRDHGEVHIVTSPWNGPHWQKERLIWLKTYFGFESHEVTQIQDKSNIKGDIIIDDKMETLKQWKKCHPSGIPILWETPHNQNDFNLFSQIPRAHDLACLVVAWSGYTLMLGEH